MIVTVNSRRPGARHRGGARPRATSRWTAAPQAIAQAPAPFGRFSDAMRRKADQIVVVVALQVHARRNAGNQAHRPMTRRGPLLRHGQPGGTQQVAVDPRALRAAHRPGPGVRQAADPAGRLRRRPCSAFRAEGGKGCNITVPFKFEAAPLATQLTPRARAGRRLQHAALRRRRHLRRQHRRRRAWSTTSRATPASIWPGRDLLLIGAGGAAAGVLGPLIEARPRRIVVANRTLAKAQALVERHAALAQRSTASSSRRPSCDEVAGAFDVVINATATSLSGAAVPVPASVLKPGALAYDMMYGPAAQGFLDWARAARRRGARRPGHAGGAGGRGLPDLARRAPALGAGAGRAARHAGAEPG